MAIKDLRENASARTAQTLADLSNAESQRPAAYENRYGKVMDRLLNEYVSKGNISYDTANDPLYRHYQKAYMDLGNMASADTVQASEALTGGYHNTYAADAAVQSNQEYLREMNAVIPDLYQAAMERHRMEGEALRNRFATVSDADERAYERYRDTVSDWQDTRDYYLGKLKGDLEGDKWRAEHNMNESQFNAKQAWDQEKFNKNLGWEDQKFRAELAWDQEQFDKNLAYMRAYDAWLKSKNTVSGGGGGGGSVHVSGGSGKKSSGGSGTTQKASGTTHATMTGNERNYDLVTDSIRDEVRAIHNQQRDQAAIDRAVQKVVTQQLAMPQRKGRQVI